MAYQPVLIGASWESSAKQAGVLGGRGQQMHPMSKSDHVTCLFCWSQLRTLRIASKGSPFLILGTSCRLFYCTIQTVFISLLIPALISPVQATTINSPTAKWVGSRMCYLATHLADDQEKSQRGASDAIGQWLIGRSSKVVRCTVAYIRRRAWHVSIYLSTFGATHEAFH